MKLAKILEEFRKIKLRNIKLNNTKLNNIKPGTMTVSSD